MERNVANERFSAARERIVGRGAHRCIGFQHELKSMISTNKMKTQGRGQLQAAAWGLGLLVGISTAGCGKSLDPQEYGKVIYEVPKVEGADTPYPLPQLDAPEQDEVEK